MPPVRIPSYVLPGPHTLLPTPSHAPPSGLAQSLTLAQSSAVGVIEPPPTRLATNPSGYPEVGNLAHSTFEVVSPQAQSRAHEQGPSPSIVEHQLDMLCQQTTAAKATLGALSNNCLTSPVYSKNLETSLPALSSFYV